MGYRARLLIAMASADLASTYAALILADEGLEITSDKLVELTAAAGVPVEPIWAQLLSNVGAAGPAVAAAPAAGAAAGGDAPAEEAKEEKKEEAKEESDDDMGFGLFD